MQGCYVDQAMTKQGGWGNSIKASLAMAPGRQQFISGRLEYDRQLAAHGIPPSVASPNYLARRGVPREPNDLKSESIIAFTGLVPDREWRYGDGRRARRILLEQRLEINDAVSAIASAEEGRRHYHLPVLHGCRQDRERLTRRSPLGLWPSVGPGATRLSGKSPRAMSRTMIGGAALLTLSLWARGADSIQCDGRPPPTSIALARRIASGPNRVPAR